jgi:hypothetical protein
VSVLVHISEVDIENATTQRVGRDFYNRADKSVNAPT